MNKVLEDWKEDEALWALANAKIIHDPDLKERKLLLRYCPY